MEWHCFDKILKISILKQNLWPTKTKCYSPKDTSLIVFLKMTILIFTWKYAMWNVDTYTNVAYCLIVNKIGTLTKKNNSISNKCPLGLLEQILKTFTLTSQLKLRPFWIPSGTYEKNKFLVKLTVCSFLVLAKGFQKILRITSSYQSTKWEHHYKVVCKVF